MLFAEAFRRKSVPDKTLEEREFTILNFVERSIAFRTGHRDLIARRLTCRMLSSSLVLHVISSVWRFSDVGGLAVRQLNKNVSNLRNRQAKIDIHHVERVLRHVRR